MNPTVEQRRAGAAFGAEVDSPGGLFGVSCDTALPPGANLGPGRAKKRILFVGEAVTTAHVVRPLELARKVDAERYEAVFACDPRFENLVRGAGLRYERIESIPSAVFLKRVYGARALYTLEELRGYVKDDLRLIHAVRPDAIVGDFRLSMGVSAELAGCPYLAISNVHWSPALHLPAPVPDHPLTKLLGTRLTRHVLGVTLPLFFRVQAVAMNRLRREYGLAALGGRGAQEVFTRGTRTLYADVPELYDAGPLGKTERYIGPVNWAADVPLPDWWDRAPDRGPVVFLTAGSSGSVRGMQETIDALAEDGWTVLVATAGKFDVGESPGRVFVADFIPAGYAMARADLAICNGGSAMVYQALAAGKPVLGIPQNMDQYYSMEAVERKGAGRLLRAGQADARGVVREAREILGDRRCAAAAREMQECIARTTAAARLSEELEEVLAEGPAAVRETTDERAGAGVDLSPAMCAAYE